MSGGKFDMVPIRSTSRHTSAVGLTIYQRNAPQKRRPDTANPPRSRFIFLLRRIASASGLTRENAALVKDQRSGKFASPSGSRQMACRWSGNTTIAMMSKGWNC